MELITTAVPLPNISLSELFSEAFTISSILMGRTSTSIPESLAICMTLFRVTPSSIRSLVGAVKSLLSILKKTQVDNVYLVLMMFEILN